MRPSVRRRLTEANTELWLVLSLLVIAGVLNFLVTSQHLVLSFYSLPTVLSAYAYGRRHATLTALGSSLIVIILLHLNPRLLYGPGASATPWERWCEIASWAGTLVVTAYVMGTLYEHKEAHVRELRETYHGVLMILRQFISKDQYTQNHVHRVSIYAVKIAAELRLSREEIEDVRAASLLHDIGKLDISRSILYKAARLTEGEYKEMQRHVEKSAEILESVGGSLRRVIPIVLAHHDKFDGSGYHPTRGEEIPFAARIITVADVYDSLVSDRPYRKGMSPFDAKQTILKGMGTEFDPKVVDAFLAVFRKGQLEISEAEL